MAGRKAVYFFCTDPALDEVAPRVFEASRELFPLSETDMTVDGYPVLSLTAPSGDSLYYVRTETVLCMAHDRYIPVINTLFSDCDLAVLVNWHGGQNAPDRVLCIHTVGDVASAAFGPSEPQLSTHLARALEKHRQALSLDTFSVTTEATHWSGIVYGGDTAWILKTPVPFLDLEIGSTRESYLEPAAAQCIALALGDLFAETGRYPVALYCGGMHFEDTITGAVLHPTHPVALTHILPSRWLETEAYTGDGGRARIRACLDSIRGGVQAIVIHEKLKREQRDLLEAIAAETGLPLLRRKALKAPEQTPLYSG